MPRNRVLARVGPRLSCYRVVPHHVLRTPKASRPEHTKVIRPSCLPRSSWCGGFWQQRGSTNVSLRQFHRADSGKGLPERVDSHASPTTFLRVLRLSHHDGVGLVCPTPLVAPSLSGWRVIASPSLPAPPVLDHRDRWVLGEFPSGKRRVPAPSVAR
jgi:hypothetical protein